MPPTQAPTGLDPTVAAQRLRDEGANELGISQRRTLRDMARLRPITDAQFLAINGVGDSKLAKYGKRFMEAIAGFDD